MNQSIQPGGSLGRYQLVSRLATGGMAEVWLARATGAKGFQKTIVVKTILPHLADDPDFLRMFIDEALLAAALNHPNIVQIFDLGQIGDTYFIAMEYILGRTMRQVQRLLKKQHKVMPPWLVLRVAMAVCDALDYAHNKRRADGQLLGIVHRDVTPENIMISFTGVIKVVDFGIAKATTGAALTRAGKIKGKLAYLAPEQIVHTGESVVDRRTDIYALGVLLYEMLTGVRPFRAPNDMALLLKIPSVIPPPPSEIARWVPTRLSDIVMKAMAKNPADRYQNARQLGDDLDVFLTSIGTYPTERHVSAYLCKLFPEEERRAPVSDWVEQPRPSEQSDMRESSAGSGDQLLVDSSGSISIEVAVDQALVDVGAAGETMGRDELRETAETPVTDLVFLAEEEGGEAAKEELRALRDALDGAEAGAERSRTISKPSQVAAPARAEPAGKAAVGADGTARPSLPAPSLRISPDDLNGTKLPDLDIEGLAGANKVEKTQEIDELEEIGEIGAVAAAAKTAKGAKAGKGKPVKGKPATGEASKSPQTPPAPPAPRAAPPPLESPATAVSPAPVVAPVASTPPPAAGAVPAKPAAPEAAATVPAASNTAAPPAPPPKPEALPARPAPPPSPVKPPLPAAPAAPAPAASPFAWLAAPASSPPPPAAASAPAAPPPTPAATSTAPAAPAASTVPGPASSTSPATAAPAKAEKRSLDALFTARPAARAASWDTVVGRVAADEEKPEVKADEAPLPSPAASAKPPVRARWDDIARRVERDASEIGEERAPVETKKPAEVPAKPSSIWDRAGKAEAEEERAPVVEKKPPEVSPWPSRLWERLGQKVEAEEERAPVLERKPAEVSTKPSIWDRRAEVEEERAPVVERRPAEASTRPASVWDRVGQRLEAEATDRQVEEAPGRGHIWDRLRQKVERQIEEAKASGERRGDRAVTPRFGQENKASDPWSVVRIDPNIEAAESFEEGLELVRLGRNEEALQAWERAVRLAPDNRRYSGNLRMLRKAMEEKS